MKIYIMGAGREGREFLKRIRFLKRFIDVEYLAFMDNDAKKQNTNIDGIPILSVEQAMEQKACNDVVVSTISVADDLKRKGFRNVIENGWRLKYFFPVVTSDLEYMDVFPFGRYDSPYPDLASLKALEADDENFLQGIDFHANAQLGLLRKWAELPRPMWETSKCGQQKIGRYHDNDWISRGGVAAIHYFMLDKQPKKIIEIGSGFSTAAMMDVNEIYYENKIQLVCVEPYPERLYSLLKENDIVELHQKYIQDVSLDLFDSLDANDILFIDSSHVAKHGSDVNYIIFDILPRLKKGVHVHFHDIGYDFNYPERWTKEEGRAYNEAYILRAFLMYNSNYQIELFGEFISKKFQKEVPSWMLNVGSGSLWIVKTT